MKLMQVWDSTTGAELLALKGQAGRPGGVVFSPDSRRIATYAGSLGENGTMKLWDAATGQELLTLKSDTWAGAHV